jgi:hypothetical protein
MKTKEIITTIAAILIIAFITNCSKEPIQDEGYLAKNTELDSFTYQFEGGLWYGISFFITTENNDIASILEPINGKFDIVKTTQQNGCFVYWPGITNDIGEINFCHSYMIHINEDCNLTVSGTEIIPPVINITPGWSNIGNPYATPQPIENVYNLPGNEFDIIKETVGQLVYWPSQGINQIENLIPGKGYTAHLQTETDSGAKLIFCDQEFIESYHDKSGRECESENAFIKLTENGIVYINK